NQVAKERRTFLAGGPKWQSFLNFCTCASGVPKPAGCRIFLERRRLAGWRSRLEWKWKALARLLAGIIWIDFLNGVLDYLTAPIFFPSSCRSSRTHLLTMTSSFHTR